MPRLGPRTPAKASFKPLDEILPKTPAGEAELEQIVNVLIQVDQARRSRRKNGVDAVRLAPGVWIGGLTIYLCWLSIEGVEMATQAFARDRVDRSFTRVVGICPTAADEGFKSTFPNALVSLREHLPNIRLTEVWDASILSKRILALPPLALHYYVADLPDGANRKAKIAQQRRTYNREITKLSMATPHVAGALAQLLSATTIKEKEDGSRRTTLLQDLVVGSVEDLGESGQDHRHGFGRLNVLRAIDFAHERGYGPNSES